MAQDQGQQVEVLLEAAHAQLGRAEVSLRRADRGQPETAHHVYIAVAQAASAGLLIEAAARRLRAGLSEGSGPSAGLVR